MSDRFQDAINATLPLLQELKDSLKPLPSASASALQRLQESASQRKKSTPAPVPREPAPSAATRTPSPAPVLAQTPSPARPVMTSEEKKTQLAILRESAIVCQKCPHLVRSRTNVVYGIGNPDAKVLFVGEAPGADEDAQGEPFVGKAGQLLTKMIQAMGYERSDIYIANILKCRPDMPEGQSGNRPPKPEEMETCIPWLRQQIDIIQPEAIVALGAVATTGLIGKFDSLRSVRGHWKEFHGIPVMITYHPAYLLRNQSISEKRKVWEDLLLVMEKLNKPISAKQRAYFTTQ